MLKHDFSELIFAVSAFGMYKDMKSELIARRIHIQGIVQGVGFRPFVYEYAILNNLVGWVRNSSAGVEIEIVGDSESINSLFISIEE